MVVSVIVMVFVSVSVSVSVIVPVIVMLSAIVIVSVIVAANDAEIAADAVPRGLAEVEKKRPRWAAVGSPRGGVEQGAEFVAQRWGRQCVEPAERARGVEARVHFAQAAVRDAQQVRAVTADAATGLGDV